MQFILLCGSKRSANLAAMAVVAGVAAMAGRHQALRAQHETGALY